MSSTNVFIDGYHHPIPVADDDILAEIVLENWPGQLTIGETDSIILEAQSLPALGAFYNVIVHGGPNWVFPYYRRALVAVDHTFVAQAIRRQPDYHGQPVRLLSCRTGMAADGFAQQLADALGAPVLAATDDVSIRNGALCVHRNGFWRLYEPKPFDDV